MKEFSVNYKGVMRASGSTFPQVVRCANAFFGLDEKAPKGGGKKRIFSADDGFRLALGAFLGDPLSVRHQAAKYHVARITTELERMGLMPAQLLEKPVKVPRLVVRIHLTKGGGLGPLEGRAAYQFLQYEREPLPEVPYSIKANDSLVEAGEVICAVKTKVKGDAGPYVTWWIPELRFGKEAAVPLEIPLSGILVAYLMMLISE